ncbi:MAG: hypothetical protein M1821_008078 [Bathelium mastoideum]|nr:MAG: hypothetical protein M1821_008078 [Bathelium mastoideum]
MDTTFISIHDLTPDARILYSSDSVVDILGHTPDEVVNRSAWQFFHPEEVPIAKEVHGRGLKLDKAAALAYCHIKNRNGEWVCCECCFTVVYDVMVCCTSIYRKGMKSQSTYSLVRSAAEERIVDIDAERAQEAPVIRRLFSSSPNDPRYHMLAHLSAKFSQGPQAQTHEPRAALFLNRFTRTLTIMYATSGLSEIIGISGDDMKGRSFYYCIAENCLQDAVHCLENAKGNDSIAYMRFWFRDPRQDDQPDSPTDIDSDEEMTNVSTTDEETEGHGIDDDGSAHTHPSLSSVRTQAISSSTDMEIDSSGHNGDHNPSNGSASLPQTGSRSSSDNSTNPADTHEAIFGEPIRAQSSASSQNGSPEQREPIELEAVVSCTSDGLVVCLRRARPVIPHPLHRPGQPTYTNGLFAAPWAAEPIIPGLQIQQPFNNPFAQQHAPDIRVPHQIPQQQQAQYQNAYANAPTSLKMGGPSPQDFMSSIRDTAIFAWALTGINGSLAEFGRGKPQGEAQPPDGFPIWHPDRSGHGEERRNGAAPNGHSFENTYANAYR